MPINKILFKNFLSTLIFVFLAFLTINLQTTVWYEMFGYFPSPNLWLPLMIYLLMYRPFPRNLLWVLFFFFILCTATTAMPFHLLLSLTSLTALVLFTQKRFSLLTMSDFILLTTSSLICFPLIYYFFSLFHSSATPLNIFDHLSTFFITLPLIPPFLLLLQKSDSMLKTTEPHYERFSTEL